MLDLKGCWRENGYGYKERYGDDWEKAVRNKVDKQLCNVKDLIDHVIQESTKIYAGTEHADTFRIFHDGLSMRWDADAQDYIRKLGFYERQLKARDPTNHNEKCKRYRNKLTGDSPELCRALDSHGFADLKRSIEYHCCLTASYTEAHGDKKFLQGTPAQVFSAMSRCWEVAPSSERIVEDILKFDAVLEKIIEADGCMVADEFLRTGRRGDDVERKYTSIKKGSEGTQLKHKAQMRQRKDTLEQMAVHRDAMDGYRHIMSMAQGGAAAVDLQDDGGDLESLMEANLEGLLGSEMSSSDSESEIGWIDDEELGFIDFLHDDA